MRNGQLNSDDAKWVWDKCLDNLTDQQRKDFSDAIHICPTWKIANKQSFNYLDKHLTSPIAIVRAKMTTSKESGKNCCANGSVLPVVTPLCVGAKVILLANQMVEDKLINGSIGEVCQICYAPGETMGEEGAKMYCVVRFPKSNLTECTVDGETDTKLVAIPLITKRCERNCCSIETIPLRVCYALTVHKVQGMSIGPDETFEKGVIHFAEGQMNNVPGLMLTAFTRLKDSDDFAVGTSKHDLPSKKIVRIGATAAYQRKKAFREELRQQSVTTMQRTISRITALDDVNEEKSFSGGCEFLLRWYRSNFSTTQSSE